jgi:hypothetical protein
MGTTTHSIEVEAPLRAVYNQWTQFEKFPNFMEGVEEVRQESPTTLFWKVNIGGKVKEWEAEITQQFPEKRITWESREGTPNTGEVNFEPLDSERTLITLTMAYEPEGILEKVGDVFGIPSSRVEGDLKRFRDFIEQREGELPGSEEEFGQEENANIVRDTDETWADDLQPKPLEPLKDRDLGVEVLHRPESIETEDRNGLGVPEADTDDLNVGYPTDEQIAIRAYQLYMDGGQLPGKNQENWLEAEKQLIAESRHFADSGSY